MPSRNPPSGSAGSPNSASHRPDVIEHLEPSQLLIVWDDGLESLFLPRELRLECECAACVDEWSRKPILDPKTVTADLRIDQVNPTGNYGLNLVFSDGHSTGIYTFRRLRGLAGE